MINIGDGFGHTENGLVVQKWALNEAGEVGMVASKRLVEKVVSMQPCFMGSSEDVFHQMLAGQAPLAPKMVSLWNPSFSLSQVLNKQLQYKVNIELNLSKIE